jgi:hypothetical protein
VVLSGRVAFLGEDHQRGRYSNERGREAWRDLLVVRSFGEGQAKTTSVLVNPSRISWNQDTDEREVIKYAVGDFRLPHITTSIRKVELFQERCIARVFVQAFE